MALSIAFYVFVYTIWLKRRTPQNIVIGGAAGAFPPMIGWAAATGDISLASVGALRHHLHVDAAAFLGAGALPLGRLPARGRADAAGGGRRARDQAPDPALQRAAGAACPGALCRSASRARAYLAAALALDALFLYRAARVWFDATERSARQLFGFSILYLFLLFLALIGDKLIAGGGA